jgi:hypothetical protein
MINIRRSGHPFHSILKGSPDKRNYLHGKAYVLGVLKKFAVIYIFMYYYISWPVQLSRMIGGHEPNASASASGNPARRSMAAMGVFGASRSAAGMIRIWIEPKEEHEY